MRIALDATALIGTRTGIGVFTHELACRLAARPDVDLTVFAVTLRGRAGLAATAPPASRVRARPAAARPLRWLWSRAAFPPAEWWCGAVDVVHGPNFVVPPAARAATVVSVHDLTPVHFPELCTADTRRYPRLVQQAIDRGAWVHTDSEFVADEVRDAFRVDPARVVTIPLGVEPGHDPTRRSGTDLAGADRYVLALGTIEPRKDFPLLVAAFDVVARRHPDVVLVIAGPDGWGVEAFEAAVAASPRRDRIRRLGYVPDDERAALLRDAAAFAYPTRYEGFGLPPLEAMAAGTPVVASDVGAVREVAGDAAVLVPPRDADAFGEALVSVLDDPGLADRLRDAGRARARRHDWDDSVDRFVALYDRARRAAGLGPR